jgi:hypothetical protein
LPLGAAAIIRPLQPRHHIIFDRLDAKTFQIAP